MLGFGIHKADEGPVIQFTPKTIQGQL